jgi:hypothetical protein
MRHMDFKHDVFILAGLLALGGAVLLTTGFDGTGVRATVRDILEEQEVVEEQEPILQAVKGAEYEPVVVFEEDEKISSAALTTFSGADSYLVELGEDGSFVAGRGDNAVIMRGEVTGDTRDEQSLIENGAMAIVDNNGEALGYLVEGDFFLNDNGQFTRVMQLAYQKNFEGEVLGILSYLEL